VRKKKGEDWKTKENTKKRREEKRRQGEKRRQKKMKEGKTTENRRSVSVATRDKYNTVQGGKHIYRTRTALFRVVTQRSVATSYRRFCTTCRSLPFGSSTP
jgi:hypothetical protein